MHRLMSLFALYLYLAATPKMAKFHPLFCPSNNFAIHHAQVFSNNGQR
jgi:hypothetical protein